MLKSYLKIAWRNITRHKLYSFINILGLALGICACIVIYLVAQFELSTDDFHADAARIYRIISERQENDGDIYRDASIPPGTAQTVREKMPGVETSAAYHFYEATITIPGSTDPKKKFDNKIEGRSTPSTIITEPAYFTIFTYDWLAGNAAAARAPYTVVLSETKARKYFGATPLHELIGKEMVYNDSLRVRVAGIVKDWKRNTDFPFSEFISFSTIENGFLPKDIFSEVSADGQSPWGSRAFVKLYPGVAPAGVNIQLTALAKTHKIRPETRYSMALQPFSDIHFNTGIEDGIRKAHLPTLYVLMGIAIFILLLAAINFINLSTALSIRRSREIGIRKVMGGNRLSIVFQFLLETFLLTVGALLIALLAAAPILSAFRAFIPDGVRFHPLDPATLGFILLLGLLVTLLAGFYPAKVLSGYAPVLSLKGVGAQPGHGKGYLRKGLIVFQFAISLIFIISTIITSRQINYMRNTDLGFTADAILSVNANPEVVAAKDGSKKMALFAQRIQQLPGIQKVSLQSFTPLSEFRTTIPIQYKGKSEKDIPAALQIADENFIPLYDIKLLAGRNLQPGIDRDSIKEFVINESFAATMGIKKPADAVGQFVYLGSSAIPIVGVVADFHENSYHSLIRPLAIMDMARPETSLAIRLAARGKELGNVKTTLTAIERVWKETCPGEPFVYSFLDESIANMYNTEQKTATLMKTAMGITIFISCMGLFGLSMFTAEQRTKEIGIRKVLGASVANIVSLLCRDIVLLIGISLVVASPVAWWALHRWLQNFAYRAPVSGWIFLLAGGAALLLGFVTVSFRSFKAAMANPVDALRTDS